MPAPRSFPKARSSRFQSLLLNSPVLVFLGGLVMWLFTYGTLDYTIGESDLFWKSVVVGVVLALLLFFLGPKEQFVPKTDRYVPLLMLTTGFVMMLPCAAGLVNRAFASGDVRERPGTVLHKRQGTGKDHSYYLDCLVGGTKAQFTVSQNLWDKVEKGAFVIVRTRAGILGYDVAEEIRPADTNGKQQPSP